jgi:hypothetical protein
MEALIQAGPRGTTAIPGRGRSEAKAESLESITAVCDYGCRKRELIRYNIDDCQAAEKIMQAVMHIRDGSAAEFDTVEPVRWKFHNSRPVAYVCAETSIDHKGERRSSILLKRGACLSRLSNRLDNPHPCWSPKPPWLWAPIFLPPFLLNLNSPWLPASALIWLWFGIRKRDRNIYLPRRGWIALDDAVIAGAVVCEYQH